MVESRCTGGGLCKALKLTFISRQVFLNQLTCVVGHIILRFFLIMILYNDIMILNDTVYSQAAHRGLGCF